MSVSVYVRDVILGEVNAYIASAHWYANLPVRLPFVEPDREIATVLADACGEALAEGEPQAIARFCELWRSIAPLDLRVRCALDVISASERRAADGSADAFRAAAKAALDAANDVDAFPLSADEAARCAAMLRDLVTRRDPWLARRKF